MSKDETPFNNPFLRAKDTLEAQLKQAKKAAKNIPAPPRITAPSKRPATATAKTAESTTADIDFLAVMGDATPLAHDPRGKQRTSTKPAAMQQAKTQQTTFQDNAAVVRHLEDLVDGSLSFQTENIDDFVWGHVQDLNPQELRRLRRGEEPAAAYLDLHGHKQDEARQLVDTFLSDRRQQKDKVVLIVHGRGHNSEANIPVLKHALIDWLTHTRSARHVLAFSSARPQDGGTGALYVLLRKPD